MRTIEANKPTKVQYYVNYVTDPRWFPGIILFYFLIVNAKYNKA